MKLKFIFTILLFLSLLFLSSCDGDSDLMTIDPTGFEVYGVFDSYNGVYSPRADKEDWYVLEGDDRYVLKKIYKNDWRDTEYEGYCWIILYDNEYLYFRNLVDSDYPPEFNWSCGIGVDKKLYVRTLY